MLNTSFYTRLFKNSLIIILDIYYKIKNSNNNRIIKINKISTKSKTIKKSIKIKKKFYKS